jgi:hypothetical protein
MQATDNMARVGWPNALRTPPASKGSGRDDALDWVKGALVLLMVLYHWLNYFIGLDWPGYPYLRFLTPSFLFITGFIVGRVYLAKYAGTPWQLAKRSWQRGLKLLAMFAVLNLADTAVSLRTIDATWIERAWPLARLEAVLLHGAGGAAFSILVPIAFFLLAVPLVWWVVKVLGVPLWLLAAGTLCAAITASQTALANAQFEFLSIGLAGAGLGAARRFDIERLSRYPVTLAIAYLGHLAVIAVWNAPFAVQVVTTYLNVLVLYACASILTPTLPTVGAVAELGRYSLFAYIVQIVALQALRRTLPIPYSVSTQVLALGAAVFITWAAVRTMAAMRMRSATADRCYRVVFA